MTLTQPQASPDGKFLYYTSGWYGQWNDVWRIPTGAGEPTKVVERALGFEGPYAVVDDGIYFLRKADRKEQVDLCFLTLATGKVRKILTIDQSHVSFLAVSPDRRTIFTRQAKAGVT